MSLSSTIVRLGAWMYPVVHASRIDLARRIHRRIGVASLIIGVLTVIALLVSAYDVFFSLNLLSPAPSVPSMEIFVSGLVLVAMSVLAPQAIFRTGTATSTRRVLDAPSSVLSPWRYSTITFNSVLVGAMLAGLYMTPGPTVLAFTLWLGISTIAKTGRNLRRDPNARYRNIWTAGSLLVIASVAYVITLPLAAAVLLGNSIVPLLIASIVATFAGILLEALDRWIRMDRMPGRMLRDVIDIRRFGVAVAQAVIAYAISWVGLLVADRLTAGNVTLGSIAALGTFVLVWLTLWGLSVSMWRTEALRTLAIWSTHQSQIAMQLADGTLDPDLAAKAALPTTSRLAMMVFGASRALTLHDQGDGDIRRSEVVAGLDEASIAELDDPMTMTSGFRVPIYPRPTSVSSVTVWDLLVPGWFATKNREIVTRFSDLATESMVLPILTNASGHASLSFDAMFNDGTHTPSLAAFREALARMRATFDAAPHLSSLVVGVFAIDEFESLKVTRNERMAVTQVMRAVTANPGFANHDLFVAYEEPGRIWVALSGGPVIRGSVDAMREVAELINAHRGIDLARTDFDVLVQVSFGYAANQVDDLTDDGLIAAALDRLATDQAVRNPLLASTFDLSDVSVESILEFEAPPVTAESLLDQLAVAGAEQKVESSLAPMRGTRNGGLDGVYLQVGWNRTFRHFDLRSPVNFLKAVNRQPNLAAKATELIAAAVRDHAADLDDAGLHDLPILVSMPSILLHQEAGELALPNLLVPALDASQATRTVLVFDDLPAGSGQAVRTLVDRGFSIAISTAAAAGANTIDLAGWNRWAVVLPTHVMQATMGVDRLTIQQAASAVGTQSTLLVGFVDGAFDHGSAVANNITEVVHLGEARANIGEITSDLPITGRFA